jgi:hypothetical protein
VTDALRLVADVIELNGQPIARLLPSVCLSIRDRLEEIFDALDEDEETIAVLETRVVQLEAKLKEGKPA